MEQLMEFEYDFTCTKFEVWLNRGTACLWMLLISAHLIAFVARCTESTLTLSLWRNDN